MNTLPHGTASDDEEEKMERTSVWSLRNQTGATVVFIMVLLVLCMLVFYTISPWVSQLRIVQSVSLLPVLGCLLTGVYALSQQERWRSERLQLGLRLARVLLPLTVVAAVVGAQLPISIAALVAIGLEWFFAVRTMTPKSLFDSVSSSQDSSNTTVNSTKAMNPTPVILAASFAVGVLLTENFFIWVVSATFPDGQDIHTAPPPLQDNGQLLIRGILSNFSRREVVGGLRRLWNVQWALVSCLLLTLLVIEIGAGGSSTVQRRGSKKDRRHLYSVASRALWTLGMARAIRTVAFSLTVLPSPVRNCYVQRFPVPVPELFSWEWFQTGFLPATHGGCNDLIVSGHATVTSTLTCVVTSVANDPTFTLLLWLLVAMDYCIEIYEGFHYSVDMWMGMILVQLIWRGLEGWEERFWNVDLSEYDTTPDEDSKERALRRRQATQMELVVYSIPSLVCYLQMAFLSNEMVNFVILAMVLTAVGIYWQGQQGANPNASMHLVQHLFLNLLIMALGVYL